MLILIIIDTQYLWNVVFSFKKGSNGQNSNGQMDKIQMVKWSDSYHLIKKFPKTHWGDSFCPLTQY